MLSNKEGWILTECGSKTLFSLDHKNVCMYLPFLSEPLRTLSTIFSPSSHNNPLAALSIYKIT